MQKIISSFCAADQPQCVAVEVASDGEGVIVTSTNHAQVGSLFFDWDEWGAFVKGAKSGEFDEDALRPLVETTTTA